MANVPVVSGAISFSSPSYTYGDTSQQIGGGFKFDLPFATVAAFTNAGLDFAKENSTNTQGFFSGVVSRAQDNISQQANRTFNYNEKSLEAIQKMYKQQIDLQKYAIKKQYGIGNMLKPGSGCFITTAVCKASGKSDTCAELQYLRKFRDDFMLSTDEGKALVNIYYRNAPAIVEAIEALPNSAQVLAVLANNFIYPAIQQISAGHFEQGQAIYSAMVFEAAKLAGVELDLTPPVKEPAKKLPPASKPQATQIKVHHKGRK